MAWGLVGKIVSAVVVGVAVMLGLTAFMLWPLAEETDIQTEWLGDIGRGEIISGSNDSGDERVLQTNSEVTFESAEIPVTRQANAATLDWHGHGYGQQHDDEHSHDFAISVQARTHDGREWSSWIEITNADDRKDGTPPLSSALVLAETIDRLQYRLTVKGSDTEASPTIQLDDTRLELIDTSRGPSPEKPKNRLQALLHHVSSPVGAIAASPSIISRAGWGSPEPNSSPRWTPEYEPLRQVIVHHTATTTSGDPAADVRAIWHYHANTLGWGDIGYNYVVDRNGRVYAGRYFNSNTAREQGGEVVAGHAFGHNRGTSGIAILGNYSRSNPSSASQESVARISGWKAAPYNFNPRAGSRLIGHRNVTSTACPGDRLYGRLEHIRQRAGHHYDHYRHYWLYDYAYRGQGFNGQTTNTAHMIAGETGTVHIDLRNTGNYVWRPTNSPLRLGTFRPRDHTSAVRTSTWVATNRPATIMHKVTSGGVVETDAVHPGETARFYFDVHARRAGNFREYFQPVREGVAWFRRDRGVYVQFNIAPKTYRWQWLSQQAFSDETMTTRVPTHQLRAGDRVFLTVHARNTGNQTWTSDTAPPVRMGTSKPRDRQSPLCDPTWAFPCHRPVVVPGEVAPGEDGTFGFWIRIPHGDRNMDRREYFNLVADGRTWMNDPGVYFHIKAQRAPWMWTLLGQEAYTDDTKTEPLDVSNVSPGQRFYVELRAKNVGNREWRADGNAPVRVGTVKNRDRASPFCDPTWLFTCHRPATVPEVVGVGEEVAIGFWMQAPDTPGVYDESFNLVSEGNRWLNNEELQWRITVE